MHVKQNSALSSNITAPSHRPGEGHTLRECQEEQTSARTALRFVDHSRRGVQTTRVQLTQVKEINWEEPALLQGCTTIPRPQPAESAPPLTTSSLHLLNLRNFVRRTTRAHLQHMSRTTIKLTRCLYSEACPK